MSTVNQSLVSAEYNGINMKHIYQVLAGLGKEFNGLVYVNPGIDKKGKVLTSMIYDATAPAITDLVANPRIADANLALIQRFRRLSVVPCMSLAEYDTDQFRETFPDWQPSPTQPRIDLNVNPEIIEVATNLNQNKIDTETTALMAKGDTGSIDPTLTKYDGFVTLALADADVTDIDPTGLEVITPANATDVYQRVYNNIPDRLINDPRTRIITSTKDWRKLQEGQSETQTQVSSLLAPKVEDIHGIPMVAISSWPENIIMVTTADGTEESNLHFGVWQEADTDAFLIYKEQPGDDSWLQLWKYEMGVQYVTGDDIFLYDGN